MANIRVEAYNAKRVERASKLIPSLLKINIEALKELEEAYQAEQHEKLFSLFCTNTKAVATVHGDIRGAHNFLLWLEDKKNKLNSEG